MRAQTRSLPVSLRWATLALSIVILLSCTALCTHIDKDRGDDGKGHCSICLSAATHKATVQPIAALYLSPEIVVIAFAADSDPLIKQGRFDSSLYIRPPPLS
jgi:hypothetical protein